MSKRSCTKAAPIDGSHQRRTWSGAGSRYEGDPHQFARRDWLGLPLRGSDSRTASVGASRRSSRWLVGPQDPTSRRGLLKSRSDIDCVAGQRVGSPALTSPTMTTPVLTPVRASSRTPRVPSSSLSATNRLRISSAARTARSASSSSIRVEPEHGHHGVADELLDDAPMPLEHSLDGVEVLIEHLAERLGVQRLSERPSTRPGR